MNGKIVFISMMSMLMAGSGFAAETDPDMPKLVMAETGVCSDKLLDDFPDFIVSDVLKNNGVAEDKIQAINAEFAGKEAMSSEESVEAFSTNSEFEADDEMLAGEVSDAEMGKIFKAVLNKHGVNDDTLIDKMFMEVQKKHMEMMEKCMSMHRS